MPTAIKILLKILLVVRVGIATNFAPTGDVWNPNPHAACLHRDLRDTDLVVAHRTLPCGSKVFVYAPRTHRGAWLRVGDRGPKHAALDLAPAATRVLRANGEETVLIVPIGGLH